MIAPGLRFVPDDLDHPLVIDLLRMHVAAALSNSPPDKTHVLDLSHLRDPGVAFWSVWEDDALVGMGALKTLAPDHAEIKSMRVAGGHQRRGIGGAIVTHLLTQARNRDFAKVSLETGGNDAFAPARAMYERAGFTPCGPFADYPRTDFNRYYTLSF